jgi:hypothetical protein
MPKIYAIALCFLSAALNGFGADRILSQTVDTTTARVQPAALGVFRGESVEYTVTPLLGSTPLSVSSNAVAVWTVVTQTNALYSVLTITGTVSTAGVSVFVAATSNTTMAAGAYDSFVCVQDGTELVTSSRSTFNVYRSPYPEVNMAVPIYTAEPLWVGVSNRVVYSNQMGSGSTWTGSNWLFSAASADFSWSNLYYLASNPSNFITIAQAAALTNELSRTNHLHTGTYQPAGTYLVPSDTNSLATTGYVASAISGLTPDDLSWQSRTQTWNTVTGKLDTVSTQSWEVGSHTGFVASTSLGSAAYSNSGDFATAAQGAKADTALQPGGNGNSLYFGLLNTNAVIVSGATSNGVNGTYQWDSAFIWTNFLGSTVIQAGVYTNATGYMIGYDPFYNYCWGVYPRTNDYTEGDPYYTATPFTLYPTGTFTHLKWVDSDPVGVWQSSQYLGSTLLKTNGSGSALTDITAAQVGALSTNGGTVSGAILSTLDHITTPPADDEVPTSRWVRGLLQSGGAWYYTTNIASGYGEKTANFVFLSTNLQADVFTNSIASPVPSSTYIAGGIKTNVQLSVNSAITFDVWFSRVGGSGSSVLPISAEIYYIYQGETNHLGDWTVGPYLLTSATPVNHQFVVAFNNPAITGAVQIIGYLKTGTVSGPAAGINIYGGDGYSSHMSISTAGSGTDSAAIHSASEAAAVGIMTNGGPTVNGQAISNGANIIVSGGGGVTNVVYTNATAGLQWISGSTLISGTNSPIPTPPAGAQYYLAANYGNINWASGTPPIPGTLTNKVVYSYIGPTNQFFDCSSAAIQSNGFIVAKLWGGGVYYGLGGFTYAYISVTGISNLTLQVGQCGSRPGSAVAGYRDGGWPNGGRGATKGAGLYIYPGAGSSQIYNGTNLLACAGGAGGGVGSLSGGDGGGKTGGDGASTGGPGTGGTQVSGGTSGGSYMRGADAPDTNTFLAAAMAIGGGGGGFYGGGVSLSTNTSESAGGGSGWVAAYGYTMQENNISDPDYVAGAGAAGNSGHGAIVIWY